MTTTALTALDALHETYDKHHAPGWPEWYHTLLFRATLLSGADAYAAWSAWAADLDLDDIDPGAQRIIPMLYRNLQALGVTHPALPRFAGMRRLTWFNTQKLFHAATPVLQAFYEAGTPTLLLKGAASLVRDYPDVSLRPMYDLDLAVPLDAALPAISHMQALGWQTYAEDPAALDEAFIAEHHGVGFANIVGLKIDLHWRVMHQTIGTDADVTLWAGALDAEFQGIPTRTLCPTDHLLHTCVHGVHHQLILPLQWVPDAALLLRTCDIDWPRFIKLARTMEVTLFAEAALTYLRDGLDVPIPSSVLQELAATPTTLTDCLAYTRRTLPVEAQRWTFLVPYLRQRRRLAGRSLSYQITEWERFLREAWDVAPADRLLPTLLRKGSRRVARVFAGRL